MGAAGAVPPAKPIVLERAKLDAVVAEAVVPTHVLEAARQAVPDVAVAVPIHALEAVRRAAPDAAVAALMIAMGTAMAVLAAAAGALMNAPVVEVHAQVVVAVVAGKCAQAAAA